MKPFDGLAAVRSHLRSVPGAVALWRRVGRLRHAAVLRLSHRRNYTFTQFCRLPTQLEQLAGPVLDATMAGGDRKALRIVVFGCSIGAEPYSLASVLRVRRPETPFHIQCFDIDPGMVMRTREAAYGEDELSRRRGLPPGFVERTFDRRHGRDGRFIVKPELRERVEVEVGDVLDNRLIGILGTADIVVGQNFLYHLDRRDAWRGIRNLIRLLGPQGVLMVDGMDLDQRADATAEAGLDPWALEIERIHEEAREERGYAWPGTYWGLEPYDARRRDVQRYYATIFVRQSGAG